LITDATIWSSAIPFNQVCVEQRDEDFKGVDEVGDSAEKVRVWMKNNK